MVETSAGNGPAGDRDFIRAASMRRVGLGISDTLWNAAVTCLGPYPAAVARDPRRPASRSDPVNPVRVPGAWLTGILRKHAAGETVDFVATGRVADCPRSGSPGGSGSRGTAGDGCRFRPLLRRPRIRAVSGPAGRPHPVPVRRRSGWYLRSV